MKTKLFKSALVAPLALLLLFFISCKDDDPVIEPDDPISMEEPDPEPEPQPDPEPTAAEVLATERRDNITILTADSEQVWRIETAQLKNIYGEFDVSNNFNIKDDELIFRNTPSQSSKSSTDFEGTLEWRRHNRLNEFAENQEETLVDDYISPAILSFDFKENSSSDLSTADAEFDFSINADGNIEGTILYEDAADDYTTLDVILTEKLASDYKQVPTSTLQFTEAFTFDSDRVDSGAVGMAGSLSDNSFFVALRDTDPVSAANVERVIRFDLELNNFTERYFETSDFVTKHVIPYNGKLLVAGGQRINTYELDLSGTVTSSPDYGSSVSAGYIGLSRFGAAIQDDSIYLIGGQLDAVANTIYKFDVFNETVSEFTTLPMPRFGARSEIVNNKLYAFGGTEEFFTPPATNSIFIYDFDSQSFTTESMPKAVNLTYTGKIENLIYVAGRIDIFDDSNSIVDREPFLGVYNTNTGTFTELETNLTSPDKETIHSMAVFDNKIYIIYGQSNFVEGQVQTWSILSADI